MLNSIRLQNFRGFRDHLLPLRRQTIIVGANNAGKSTAIEAMRLVSLVANRYRNLNYSHPPPESGLPVMLWVASPSLENFNINFDHLYYLLGDPPAVITAQFTGGEIAIYLVATKRLYAVVRNPAGKPVKNKSDAGRVDLDGVHILPQVAPLMREERILTDNYVRAHVSSALAPLHFRNQLRLMPESYVEFTRLVAETWPG
ncbi:MAG TPA: AAA family ATPase, partial [Dehalococcoidia bacterium]|nr:AAA family ATPase [Dehalococcoidia bacterium]